MTAPRASSPPARTPRPYHRFLWKGAGLLVILFATGLVAGRLLSLGDEPAAPSSFGGDFLVGYAAGTLAAEARFEELHDPAALMERIRTLAALNGLPSGGGGVGPWLNPPFFLWHFMVLTALPYKAALAVWTVLSAASIAVSAGLLARMLRPTRNVRRLKLVGAPQGVDWNAWALVPVLTFLSMPAIQTLSHGQSSGLSLLILCLAVTFWRAGRGFAAGIVLGLLFYKPQLAMIVAAVMVLDLGRRALLGLVTTGAALAALTVLLMPEELSLYLRHAPSAAALMQADGLFPWQRHATFTAFWRLLLQGTGRGATGPLVVSLGAACALALIVPLLVGLARHRRPALLQPRGDRAAVATRRDRLIAATVAAMPLVMPYYMDYDLLLLAVPAVLFARELLHAPTASPPDVWVRRAWVAAFVWLYPSAGFAATFGANLNVPLLAVVAGLLVARSVRRDAPGEQRPWLPVPISARRAAA